MIDYTGQHIGELHVICRHPVNTPYNAARWICHCSCGNYCVVSSKELKSGGTKSCGHLRVTNVRKANIRHGKKLTPEYTAFASAKNRCQNPRNQVYWRYGAKGIKFNFTDFQQFWDHIGPRPSKEHSLDRWPKPRGNYELGNVRWATDLEQAGNRRCEHCDRREDVLELSRVLAGLSLTNPV